MGLAALDGSVDVGRFEEEFWLVVVVLVGGRSEQIVPVLFVDSFAEEVVHFLALGGELALRFEVDGVGGVIGGGRIDGIAGTVSE